jgi:GNAT superfamily N-acetyltransferase
MSVQIRSLTAWDRDAALALVGRYLPGSEDTLNACVEAAPDLALVCAEGAEIVGVCFAALPHEGEGVVLDGIAIEAERAGDGLGSALLAAFEDAAALAGFSRISLGSAEGYVEHFYEKNGYTPVEFLVTTAEEPELDDALEVLRWRDEGEAIMLNLSSANGYGPEEKERIRELTAAHEVLLVFEKRLV